MMKLRARITMEAEITKGEAELLVEYSNCELNAERRNVLWKQVKPIIEKCFPNYGPESYIPCLWMWELANELGVSSENCEDVDFVNPKIQNFIGICPGRN